MVETVDVCIPSINQLSESFVQHLRERLPIHCVLRSDLSGRGRARQDLIQRVDTDWFAFVDTDVRLRVSWWDEVTRLVRPEVGAIEGLWSYVRSDKRVDDYGKAMERLAKRLRRPTWSEKVERPFTGDTLILKKAVERIKIPNINIYEDEYIRRHVVREGYEWCRTPVVVCDHLRRYNLDEAYESGRFAYFFQQTDPAKEVRKLFLLPPKVMFALASTRNFGIIGLVGRKNLSVLKGILHAYIQDKSEPGFRRRLLRSNLGPNEGISS